MSENRASLESIVGVYHADGGIFGELRYVTGKIFKTTHCALCDISHGMLTEKQAFKTCRATWPVPVSMVHLNERERDVAAFTEGKTPCVVGRMSQGLVMLMDAAALEDCAGSVAAFRDAMDAAIQAL